MAPQLDPITPGVSTAIGVRLNQQQIRNMRAQESVANTMQVLNSHQSASAFYQSELDRMQYEVFLKNPWLREFAAISRAAGGSKLGVGAAAAKQLVESAKGAMK